MAGPDAPGRLLGRYRLAEAIGAGSFATVHRAVDDRLDDVVVLKVLAENHSLNPEIRERFIAEGRALRRVASPHVVAVHDIGESDLQQPYLVLEHADRGTLAARVAALRADGWTATPADVLAVARGLAAAVEAVHAARLVHRDLSPGNVLLATGPEPHEREDPDDGSALVRADERLLVADLGMCKDLARSSGLTVAGGTEGFRAPEQDGPGIIDTRADLWAMSALVTWLTEGATLPGALTTALRRSLADSPARRHPDAAAWLADVERALGATAHTEGSLPGRRRPWRVAVAAVAGAALGLGAGVGVMEWNDDGPRSSVGAASVAVTGPRTATVGEPVTLTAEVAGLEHWVWVMPTGAYVADEATVQLTASSPGTAEVVLEARAGDGTPITATHRLEVSAGS